MAKTKNKKRKLADNIQSKKELKHLKKSMNPFEVHVNKEKLRVLGKKLKNDRGLPGVSRTKALEKRKKTLLQEYKVQNKSNKFMDKRIGERNNAMTFEDKIMARFAAVRVKAHNKKSIFNLADDEILTHKGQTLSEIEKFDDPRSDDEESLDENRSGKLDADFVEDAHFGGGILKKTGQEGVKSHKELIDQLITESKKRKAEKQKQKEATLELTEKLDTEWKDLLPLVSKNKTSKEGEVEKPKIDDYDKVMRELRFEARGTVSDRLKTEDELVKEEKEKLEQLERERLERMRGFVDVKPTQQIHRSADDLDDDFVYESDSENLLSYNTEGESNVKIDAELNGNRIEIKTEASENEVECVNKSSEHEECIEEEESGDEGSENSKDNLSDLKEQSSESEEECDKDIKSDFPKIHQQQIAKTDIENIDENCVHSAESSQESIKADLLKRKEIMEKARQELPYTFSLPNSYEDLQNTFKGQTSSHQNVIVERMIKCNHPSLAEKNKENLGILFAYLLQYLNDCAAEATNEQSIKNCFDVFMSLEPQLYDLAQLNDKNAHSSVLEVIKEKHADFRIKQKQYPDLEILLFFKLVSLLFSTSDFRHQIVTPCFVFMEQMLTKCKVRTKRDISYGLFIVTLVLEYTTLSKRYLPATINFLGGVLHMCIPKTGVRIIKVLPPFKSTSNDLVLLNNYSEETVALKMECSDLTTGEIDEEYKIRVFFTTIKLLLDFLEILKPLPSSVEIFEPIAKYLQQIPTNNYPKIVMNEYNKLVKLLDTLIAERKLIYIVRAAEKPKALRLYEPKIEEVYDGKRYKVQSREKAERAKLMHKLKRERKGALREIRRDQAFLGRVKIHQQIQSDKKRKDKVKRIYAEASMQQSELNALDRNRKKK